MHRRVIFSIVVHLCFPLFFYSFFPEIGDCHVILILELSNTLFYFFFAGALCLTRGVFPRGQPRCPGSLGVWTAPSGPEDRLHHLRAWRSVPGRPCCSVFPKVDFGPACYMGDICLFAVCLGYKRPMSSITDTRAA